ncbi:MAG: SixA phosphatase family protein [Acidimicrobiales bacterium]
MSPTSDRLFWLLRHAKTLADPPKGGGDHERKLAPRGRKDADALGARLGAGGDRLGFSARQLPALVLCSDATRTTQTAERALSSMTRAPAVDRRRSLYTASPDEVIGELRGVDDAVTSVMVVGHNPTAGALAESMLDAADKSGRQEVGRHGFPTCALAVYRLPAGRWREVALGTGTLVGLFLPPF